MILATTQNYDPALLRKALQENAAYRGTTEQFADVHGILQLLFESLELCELWNKYKKQFA